MLTKRYTVTRILDENNLTEMNIRRYKILKRKPNDVEFWALLGYVV